MKKKLLNVLAILTAACMLVGCGGKETESKETEQALHEMDVEKYVTLGEYKGIEVTMPTITVDESEVDSLVSNAYSNAVTKENGGITDRAVAVGDTANIDYVGKKDDVAFDGGTASGFNLTIGSGQFIDGFEDGLVGVMPGETVDLNLTFPAEYHSADLAGAEVVFTVTVNFIQPSAEDMQDSVIAALGIEGIDTVEALRQYAYDYLYSTAEQNYNASIQSTVLNTFMSNCEFKEVPQWLTDKYFAMAEVNINQQAANYGMDGASFVNNFYGMTMEEFVSEYSVEMAKRDIALQAIANQENLNISDEELDTTLQTYATASGYETVEEFLGEEPKDNYRAYLTAENVVAFMIENAVVNNE